jgi:hypothetical protein
VDAIAHDLVKKIEHGQRSHGIVTDLRLEIGRWSLENAGNMVFDKRLGCLGELFIFFKSFLVLVLYNNVKRKYEKLKMDVKQSRKTL